MAVASSVWAAAPSEDCRDLTLAEAEAACSSGVPRCCVQAAEGHLNAGDVCAESDPARAAPLLLIGCDAGVAEACALLGHRADGRRGFPSTRRRPALLTRAARLYGARCREGDAAACAALAQFHDDGDGVRRDPSQARKLGQKALTLRRTGCGSGDDEACLLLARMHAQGEWTAAAPRLARSLYDRQCRRGDLESCREGGLFVLSAGTPESLAHALEMFSAACEARDAAGCTYAARALEQSGDDDRHHRAAPFLERACTLGNRYACLDLAIRYEDGRLPADAAAAAGFRKRACDGVKPCDAGLARCRSAPAAGQ